MKQVLMSKLLRRVLILALLLTTLVFAAAGDSTVRPVYAAPCCQECDAQLSECLSSCSTSPCRLACFEENNDCSSHCIMCGSPPGGAACVTSADCPWSATYGEGTCVNNNCVY